MNKIHALRSVNRTFKPQRIIYEGRRIKSKNKEIKLSIDVRNYITVNDAFVVNFAKVSGATAETSYDKKAWLVQKAVCKYMTYVYDEQNEGYTEFWQFPFETLALRYGDCEDGAILMAATMIASGIPADRVKVCAGLVETGDPHDPTGGHAYTAYVRESDMKIVILDWCYYQDPQIPVANKPTLAENKKYKDMWFSFNNLNSWGIRKMRIGRK